MTKGILEATLQELQQVLDEAGRYSMDDPEYRMSVRGLPKEVGATIRGRGEGKAVGPGGVTPETNPELFTSGGYYKAGPGQRAVRGVMKKAAHLMRQYVTGDELQLGTEQRAAMNSAAEGIVTKDEAMMIADVMDLAAGHIQSKRKDLRGNMYIARLFTTMGQKIRNAVNENPLGRGYHFSLTPGDGGEEPAPAKKSKKAGKKAGAKKKKSKK